MILILTETNNCGRSICAVQIFNLRMEFQSLNFRGDINIKVSEDFENDTANGTRLWEAGMLLTRFIELFLSDQMKKKSVLELGSGTGVTGIYLGLLGAQVVAADNNDIVLPLLKSNVVKNKVEENVKVIKFDWCKEEDVSSIANTYFDYIIGADCVFSLAATDGLCKCLERLMKGKKTVGYMCIGKFKESKGKENLELIIQ